MTTGPGDAYLKSPRWKLTSTRSASALGEDAFTAAWDAGRALSLEAAVGLALSSGGQ